jgi:hypothetical protein
VLAENIGIITRTAGITFESITRPTGESTESDPCKPRAKRDFERVGKSRVTFPEAR